MMVEPSKDWKLDWTEVVVDGQSYYRSGRAVDIIEWAKRQGFDFDGFMRRHTERAGAGYWGQNDIRGEEQGRTKVYHLHALSFFDYDYMRIIAIDTCERRLVMESFDLRCMLESEAIPPEKLRLWRADSQSKLHESMNNAIVASLLDRLEKYSIHAIFEENEVDLGKFF